MNQENTKSNKKILSLGIIFLVLIVVATALYFATRPKTHIGSKKIIAKVVLSDESSKDFTIHTDQEFLRAALEEKDLIKGEESAYGLMVTVVNGIAADQSNQEWWAFTKNGEFLMTGVDDTPIEDGDHFEITLTIGY